MIIKKLRLQRGWSQDQLAQMSGLNIRTIQRIERGQKPGLESLKSLAAVFEVDFSHLIPETDMNNPQEITQEEQQALDYVREVKGFYSHLVTYLLVMVLFFIVNYMTNPDYIWAWWSALGWGIGVVSHAVSVFQEFDLFGADWERKQVEKRLGRKL